MEYSYINIDYSPNFDDKIKKVLVNKLSEVGMTPSFISATTFSLDSIKNVLGTAPNDLVIVALSSDYKKNIELKNELCTLLNTFLVKNTACSFAIESFLRLYNGKIDNNQDFENECLIPDGAEPLVSDKGFVQGYMLNFKNMNFCFLPPEETQVIDILDSKLKILLKKIYSIPSNIMYLKAFGLNYSQVDKVLNVFKNNSMGITLSYSTELFDTKICIGYSDSTDTNELNNFISQICETMKKYIYATEDISIQNMALDLSNIAGKKISLLESLTNGQVYIDYLDSNYKVAKKSFATTTVCRHVSDLNYLSSLDRNMITSNGLYSVESVYEIATAVLNENNCDIAVVSIASYDENTNNCISIIAVGDVDGIHIYKNVYNDKFINIKKIISNSISSNLIKKLKQNDFENRVLIN